MPVASQKTHQDGSVFEGNPHCNSARFVWLVQAAPFKSVHGCVNLTQASQGFAQPVPRPRTITVPARTPRVVPAQGLAQGDGLAVGLERVTSLACIHPQAADDVIAGRQIAAQFRISRLDAEQIFEQPRGPVEMDDGGGHLVDPVLERREPIKTIAQSPLVAEQRRGFGMENNLYDRGGAVEMTDGVSPAVDPVLEPQQACNSNRPAKPGRCSTQAMRHRSVREARRRAASRRWTVPAHRHLAA